MISDLIKAPDSGIDRGGGRTKASAAGLLSLAATPTFAIMALLTAVHGGGMPDMICSVARDESPLTGMIPMYVLMSVFHVAPWLKLVAGWGSGVRAAGRHAGGVVRFADQPCRPGGLA